MLILTLIAGLVTLSLIDGRPQEDSPGGEKKFRIFAVTDMDERSKVKGEKGDYWVSYLKEGTLTFVPNDEDPTKSKASLDWDDSRTRKIASGYSYAGRGLELSTLNKYNGKLYACDDRTGIIYELPISEYSLEIKPVPWVIMADMDASNPKEVKAGSNGFKCEWAVIKDGDLWVGGHGVTKKGKNNEKYVRIIGPDGAIKEIRDWTANFDKMDAELGIVAPGYITHEAAGWSTELNKWVFMPRKISPTAFNAAHDDVSASNTVILADETFENIEITTVGAFEKTHGFSSFKFIPGTKDQVFVALKAIELESGPTASFAMISDLSNNTLMEETKFDDKKYEGIEFFRR